MIPGAGLELITSPLLDTGQAAELTRLSPRSETAGRRLARPSHLPRDDARPGHRERPMTLDDRLRNDADELPSGMTEMRHDLHRHPESGLDLPRTQQAVLTALEGLPLEISTGTGCTSVTAVL